MPAPEARAATTSSKYLSTSSSRQPPTQDLCQDDGVVVFCVVSRVDQRQRSLSRPASERRELRTVAPKLLDVAPAKLLEAFGLMPEPPPQLGARGELFLPGVEPGSLPGYPARPEPVDQHAATVRGCRWLMRALQADIQLQSLWSQPLVRGRRAAWAPRPKSRSVPRCG